MFCTNSRFPVEKIAGKGTLKGLIYSRGKVRGDWESGAAPRLLRNDNFREQMDDLKGLLII